MDPKTKGAWLVHHARKLQDTNCQDFDCISFSGKCGTLLSAISGEQQLQLSYTRLNALAKANSISPRSELPTIIDELERQRLVSKGNGGIETLGLSGHLVLEKTAAIFEESEKTAHEQAVIDVSESASDLPLIESECCEAISDYYKLTSQDCSGLFEVAEDIGFFDSEQISNEGKLIFNGNLFKKGEAHKLASVVSSLNSEEQGRLIECNEKLNSSGCIALEVAEQILGKNLLGKLHSIGVLEISMVGNSSGKSYFVTRPSAFSKFSSTIADDALDLAKAFVSSLTYGMTKSSYYRGRIGAVSALVNKLIDGGEVGPASAIGQDYQALEYRGVVSVRHVRNGMYSMSLLKPEVGRLALSVIQHGDITAEAISTLPGADITDFAGPEVSRAVRRKKSKPAMKQSAKELLDTIRTGGFGQ
ncbi:hypothetical protein [Rubritalea sp.]|uniref:hypothetical protein n=1 Tax=Rubritalea sp. TaxID=2109375 RepID=UPI003EF45889